jgi:hypothetical protein
MPQIEQVVVTNNNTGLPGIHSILVMRFWSQMVALNAWSATPAQPIPLLRALSTIAMLTRLSGYIRDKAYDFALPTYIPTQENPTLPRCTHSVVRADRTVGRRPPVPRVPRQFSKFQIGVTAVARPLSLWSLHAQAFW